MIYTVGYSTRSLPEFTKELEKRNITRLVDVRSRPSSRNPSFNRKAIERWSEKLGIYYSFEGEALGGDPDEGRELSAIVDAISRIASAAKSENVAIMCAEGDPAKCHRTWDIAVYLIASHEIAPISILRDGTEEQANKSLQRVSKRNLPDHASRHLSTQRSLF